MPTMGIAHRRQVITCIFRASGRVDVPEGDLFRRPQLAIFVGVAWNPLRACTYLAALSWRAGIEQRARAISFWN